MVKVLSGAAELTATVRDYSGKDHRAHKGSPIIPMQRRRYIDAGVILGAKDLGHGCCQPPRVKLFLQLWAPEMHSPSC